MKVLILSLLRRILRSKTNLLINLLGISIGMIAFLFISAWVVSEKSYDKFWNHSEDIYRVELQRKSADSELLNTAMNFKGVGPVLKNEIPEVEAATMLDKDIITVFTPEASVQNINMFFTDSSFFKVFPRKIRSENSKLLFADIHNAVISQSLAQKLFGARDPLNETFKLNEGWQFNVVGIFEDVPENSHIKFDLILQHKALMYYMRNFDCSTGVLDNSKLSSFTERDPYSQSQWRSLRSYTYIRLKPGSSIRQVEQKYTDAIRPCIQHIIANNESVKMNFMPVTDIHLHSDKDQEMFVNGSYLKVFAFMVIGLLLIITSLLNFVNISVASSLNQTASRGVHLILGAGKRHLFVEFFSEAFIVNFLAGVFCFLSGTVFLRHGMVIGGFKIFPVGWETLALISGIMVFAGTLLSAFYPFLFVMTRMLKSARNFKVRLKGSNYSSIKALVVFQFCISIFLIIGTIAVFRQVNYMQNTDTGMDMEQTMVSFSPMTMIKKPDRLQRLQTFRMEIQKIPGVKDFTTAEIVAGKGYDRISSEVFLQGGEKSKYPFVMAHIDYDYFDFFSIGKVAGNFFQATSPKDGDEVIVNETACRQLGIAPDGAVNRFLMIDDKPYRIKGVVKDYHHLSLKHKIDPVIYFNSLNWFRTVGYYFVTISGIAPSHTISEVNKLWTRIYPEEEYHYSFLDDRFNAAYEADLNFGRVFLILSVLVIFIASMGLFALAKFASGARIKEIGIRKVNGARVTEVLVLLNKDFLKWVALAFLIAAPVAWYVMDQWIENFAYRTNLDWWIFALSGGTAMVIALLTVSWQSWHAAICNPVEALRDE
jgi:putative ABC transport system permease protein